MDEESELCVLSMTDTKTIEAAQKKCHKSLNQGLCVTMGIHVSQGVERGSDNVQRFCCPGCFVLIWKIHGKNMRRFV